MFKHKLVLIIIMILVFPSITLAKKRCKPLLEKLHRVQALQRKPYSAQKGISLRNREDKARDLWWQCENGSSKTKKKINKKKKQQNKKSRTKGNYFSRTTKVKNKKNNVVIPFKTSNAIVIKSKYKGDKQVAWLTFYQQPSQCIQPKKLSVFAFCSENKQAQRADFEKYYSPLK
jgi:hypothetical protein